jgi:hypothetical protein
MVCNHQAGEKVGAYPVWFTTNQLEDGFNYPAEGKVCFATFQLKESLQLSSLVCYCLAGGTVCNYPAGENVCDDPPWFASILLVLRKNLPNSCK